MRLKQFLKWPTLLKTAAAAAVLASAAQQATAGSIERLIYYDANGSVGVFTNIFKFPSQPNWSEQLDDFKPPQYGLQSKHDGQYYPLLFGSYTRGYLEAPTNGNFTFFIASYNDSQLWLGTNELATGRQLIAYETNQGTALFSGPRLSTRQSAPIPLVGGKKYYLEILHQANIASNSYVQIGWQTPDGTQEIIPTRHLAQFTNDPYSGSVYTSPQFNTYGLNHGDLPSVLAANEGTHVILESDVIAAQPTTFKWYRNSVLLTNQNLSYLELSPVHAADNGASYYFQVSNAYGTLTSASTILSITPDTTPPVVSLVDARGNPNGVRVTYSKPVSAITATNSAHYVLKIQGGSSLVVTSATLLTDQQSVQLAGNFNFQSGTIYQLTVSSVQDQSTTPNTLSPNPTTSTFIYTTAAGVTYTFNDGLTNGFNLFGNANLAASGSYDGSGYADLTDAAQYQQGVIQFSNQVTLEQFHLNFKARIGSASATPGDGFSINLASDLPSGTFINQQQGYVPISSPHASRLVVAFDNSRLVSGTRSPAIVVKWLGNIVTNVLTGTGGIPSINSADGHWATVDLQLQRGGKLSLSFDGVQVFTNLAPGFVPFQNAQLEIAAQTSANFETHWFDDVYVNYNEGGVGPAGFSSNPALASQTVLEGQPAPFAVVPTGAAPFTYQWYYNGSIITNATNSILSLIGRLGTNSTAGNYSVTVRNEFSSTNSAAATLTVTADTTPLQLLGTRISAFGNNQVVLTFNKPVDPASATSLSTYNLGTLGLYAANLSADGLSVTLSTGTQERNQVYLFTITGLKDTTAAGNPLTTTSSFVTTVSGLADYAAQIITDGAVRDWRFDEPAGSLTVASLATATDPIGLGVATFNGLPTLEVQSLVPNQPLDTAIGFSSATGDWLLVPNGSDINTGGPYPQKSFEFWFNASALPAPGTTGLNAANTLFEEGGSTRGLAFYLWRDPANPDPGTSQLIFHAWNNPSDGPGSPWGASSSLTTPAVYAQATIQAGQTYHVVGVLNGDPIGTTGQLILYLNGVPVSTVGGVGQLYAHTSDIEIARGATLLHTGDSGTTPKFSGVLDDLSLYNASLSASTVALHYQAGTNTASVSLTNSAPLTLARLDTLGNPNSLVLTFSKALAKNTATNLANYVLKNWAGTTLNLTNATLLGGSSSVQLHGSFGFLVNSNYTLTVSSLLDQSAGSLTPNSTNVAFSFAAPTGTTYSFNAGLPVGVQIAGNAYVTNSGSYDGSGYIVLTDATTNQNSVLLFTDRHDITQAHIRFKARLSNGSTLPGSGFSVNIAPDLSAATFAAPETGYLIAPFTNRLTIAFNNVYSAPPSISVAWWGTNLAKVLTGTGGIPPLNSADGHWANVDINLQLSGLLSVSYDGVTVITNLATGFQPIAGAQVSLAAETTTAYETHWFDDINLNFAEGSIGSLTIPASGQPQNTVQLENQPAYLSVVPQGTAPFAYQWYFTNAPLAGATNRILTVIAHTNTAGAYKVKVWDNFSSVTSQVATVTVQLDQNPASVKSIFGYAGGVNQVQITFDRELDQLTAKRLSTYSLNTVSITNVTLDASGTVVTLYTTQQQNLQTNRLTITGLFNYAAIPHVLNTNVTFQSAISYYQEALVDGPVRYFRFDETNGNYLNSDVSVIDSLPTSQGTFINSSPTFGVPALFTNSTGTAIQFNHANTNYVQFTAKEYDLTWTNTGAPHVFTNKTVEFWFKANSLPYAGYYTDTNGAQQVTNHAYGLWSEGANARYFVVYLYGTDNTTTNPTEAQLVLNAGNIAADGPGAYGQWGTLAGGAAYAVYVSVPVTTGVVYQVVAQLAGGADDTGSPTGQLLLYTNGVLAGTSANSAGLLYGHAGTNIRIATGANNFRHDGVQFSFTQDSFDGVIDDLVYYESLLSPDRIAAHYQAAQTPPLITAPSTPPVFGSFAAKNGGLSITWSGSAQLQRSTNVAGPYTTVSGAASPYQEPTTNAQVFFRLVR